MKATKPPVVYHSLSMPVPFLEEVKKHIKNRNEYRSIAEFVRDSTREKMRAEKEWGSDVQTVSFSVPFIKEIKKSIKGSSVFYDNVDEWIRSAMRDKLNWDTSPTFKMEKERFGKMDKMIASMEKLLPQNEETLPTDMTPFELCHYLRIDQFGIRKDLFKQGKKWFNKFYKKASFDEVFNKNGRLKSPEPSMDDMNKFWERSHKEHKYLDFGLTGIEKKTWHESHDLEHQGELKK